MDFRIYRFRPRRNGEKFDVVSKRLLSEEVVYLETELHEDDADRVKKEKQTRNFLNSPRFCIFGIKVVVAHFQEA